MLNFTLTGVSASSGGSGGATFLIAAVVPPLIGSPPLSVNEASAYPAVGIVIVDGGQLTYTILVQVWSLSGIVATLATFTAGSTANSLSCMLAYNACAKTLSVVATNGVASFTSGALALDLALTLSANSGAALFSSYNAQAPVARTISATTFVSGLSTLRCSIVNYTSSRAVLTLAMIPSISAVVWGTAGVSYVAAGNAIFLVSATGSVSLLAGDTEGFVDAQGSNARFSAPRGLAFDSLTLFVADSGNNAIRRVNPISGIVVTVSGQPGQGGGGVAGYLDGLCSVAQFNTPSGVAILSGVFQQSGGADFRLIIADTNNNALRVITISNSMGGAGCDVTLLSGSSEQVEGAVDGPLLAARFSLPIAVAVDASANIYTIDSGGFTIRRLIVGGLLTTLAGFATWSDENSALVGAYADGAAIGVAAFSTPAGIAVNAAGTRIFITDAHAVRVLFLDPQWPAAVWTVAGSLNEGYANGVGAVTAFSYPSGITINDAGDILVADTGNGALRTLPVGIPSACPTSSVRPSASATVSGRATASATATASVYQEVPLGTGLNCAANGGLTGSFQECTVKIFAGSFTAFGTADGLLGTNRFSSNLGYLSISFADLKVDSFGASQDHIVIADVRLLEAGMPVPL